MQLEIINMKLITLILVVTGLIALAVLGLAIQIIFSKRKEFPDTHIGHNPNMKGLGITCATTFDKTEQKKGKKIPFQALHLSNNK